MNVKCLLIATAGLSGVAAQGSVPVVCSSGLIGQAARDYFYEAAPMTWDAAIEFCQEKYPGGDLASILSSTTNECIAEKVIPQGPSDQAWIGLTDDDPYSPGKMDFRWTDTPDMPISYTNWNAGEPADSDERCGRMYSGGMGGAIGGTWNNDLCSKTAAFVCQGPPIAPTPAPGSPTPPPSPPPTFPPTPPPTPIVPITCEGRQFYFHAAQVSWESAEVACADDGGQLASIHSMAENTCLASTVMPQTGSNDQAWIGLTDDAPYSVQKLAFLWTDSSSANFFNWNGGEPADSEERCGRLYRQSMGGDIGGKWNNDLCSKRASFICQKQEGPQIENCPGADSTGNFDYMPDCPADFLTPTTEEWTLNTMCDSYCQSNCAPSPKKRGIVSIASPFGNSSTCVCYASKFGDSGLTRVPYGGCGFKSESLSVTPACSKSLWSMPRTHFITEYAIGFGFGPADKENEAPFGSGTFSDKVHAAGKVFNSDAQQSWDACLGTNPDKINPKAPCYETYRMQEPDTCTCIDETEGTMNEQCGIIGGKTCPLNLHWTNQNKKSWTANGIGNGCFPTTCTNADIQQITQYVIDEWVPQPEDDETYRLTDIIVPKTCGGGGGGGGSNTGKVAGEVIGGLFAVGIVGAGAFLFMKHKRGSVGNSNALTAKFTSRPARNNAPRGDLFSAAGAGSSGSRAAQESGNSAQIGKLASDYEEL